MYETDKIKFRQDGSINTGYYMKLGRQCRSEAAHAATSGLFKRLAVYLVARLARKPGLGRLTHFDRMDIDRFVPANDTDRQVVNAYKFRGVI